MKKILKITLYLCALMVSVNLTAAEKPALPKRSDGAAKQNNIPTLAIINKSKDKVLADLLFIELAKDEKINLVEREKIEIIQKEHEYNTNSKDNNIELGKLLKADGLLFIESGKDYINVKLVETLRGQKVLDLAFPAKKEAAQIVSQLKENFSLWKKKLAIPPEQRIYISVIPILYGNKLNASPEAQANLNTFNALLSVYVSNADGVFALEREDLSAVAREKEISQVEDIQDLNSSDYIIRGKTISLKGKDKLVTELQLLPVKKKGKDLSLQITLKKKDLPKIAIESIKKLLPLITTAPQAQKNLAEESKLFQNKGTMCLLRDDYLNAIQFFEISSLLDPNNKSAQEMYVLSVVRYLPTKASPVNWAPWTVPWRFTKAEYMQMISFLRQALAIAKVSKNQKINNLLCGEFFFSNIRTYALLSVSYKKISESEKKEIQTCRKELKEFFKEFCQYDAGCPDRKKRRIFLIYSPIMFETPKECFDSIKPLLQQSQNPWLNLRSRYFDGVKYWNRKEYLKNWGKLLKELSVEDSKYTQYNSLIALCETEKSIRIGSIPYDKRTKTFKFPRRETFHFENYLSWLQDPENFSWLLKDPTRTEYAIHAVLNGFHFIPIKHQNKLFEKIALAVFQKNHVKKERIGIYIEFYGDYFNNRYLKNIVSKNRPEDKKDIRELVTLTMKKIKQYAPDEYSAHEFLLKRERWFAPIMGTTEKITTKKLEIEAAQLLYKYKLEKPAEMSFYPLNMFYENKIAWVAWPNKKGVHITRIDLTDKFTSAMQVDLPKSGMCGQLKITRFKNYLCIAGFLNITIIPILNKKPYLDIGEKIVFGPKIGDSELGLCMSRNNLKRVSSLIPGKSYLFFGLNYIRNGVRSGSIYKWDPISNSCEKVCASDSLTKGPLNDCPPYKLIAGIKNPKGKGIFFLLHGRSEDIQGIWRFTPATNSWEHLKNTPFPENHVLEITPPFIFADKLFVSTFKSCFVFDPKTLKLENRYTKFHLGPDQRLVSPIPVCDASSSIWAAIREKGPLYLHSVNQIRDQNKITCLYKPENYRTKVKCKITTPLGLVVAILSDYVPCSPTAGSGWLTRLSVFLVPNDIETNQKNENK